MRAVLTTATVAGVTDACLVGAAVRLGVVDDVTVDGVSAESLVVVRRPPLDDTFDVGFASLPDTEESDAAECFEPLGFRGAAGLTVPDPGSSVSATLSGSPASVGEDPEDVVAEGVSCVFFGDEPDVPEGVSAAVEDESESGVAQAVAGIVATADPMPNATANAPIRPTYFA
jgi:hypothetical protein